MLGCGGDGDGSGGSGMGSGGVLWYGVVNGLG